jgi:hypothetical protein
MAAVDGVEVAHPMLGSAPDARADFDAFLAHVVATNRDVARIGSSDYHISHAPGQCRTYLFAREPSREGVLEAIRAGRTVGRRVDGTLVGDPALVEQVRAHRQDESTALPLARSLSGVCSWLGMAGLMLSLPLARPASGPPSQRV